MRITTATTETILRKLTVRQRIKVQKIEISKRITLVPHNCHVCESKLTLTAVIDDERLPLNMRKGFCDNDCFRDYVDSVEMCL